LSEIPNARRVVFAGVGHLANMEVPESFNAEITRFLADTTPAAPG
jgi:pimeloyl-ACP methyl ester carboxylesterase